MNIYKTALFLLIMLLTYSACDWNDTLTEEEAKKAGEHMLALKNQEDLQRNILKLVKWKGFILSSDTKADLWAIVQSQTDTNCLMSGSFNFMKPKDGDWMLSSYYFHSDNRDSCIWSKDYARYIIPR